MCFALALLLFCWKNFIRMKKTRKRTVVLLSFYIYTICKAWSIKETRIKTTNEKAKKKLKQKIQKKRKGKTERNDERRAERIYIFLLSAILCVFYVLSLQSSWLFQDHQRTLKKVHPMNGNSHKKINHKNFRLNVDEYYSGGKRNDANAFMTVAGADASAAVAVDRGHSIAMRDKLDNVNSKPTKAFDNANRKYDEGTLSRCTLLLIGSLCQQGKRRNFQNFLRVIFLAQSCCCYCCCCFFFSPFYQLCSGRVEYRR